MQGDGKLITWAEIWDEGIIEPSTIVDYLNVEKYLHMLHRTIFPSPLNEEVNSQITSIKIGIYLIMVFKCFSGWDRSFQILGLVGVV